MDEDINIDLPEETKGNSWTDIPRITALGLNHNEMVTRLKWYEKQYGPYVEKRGLNNWKNLFRKPTMLEWTILFMLVMGLFAAWAYKNDIQGCVNNACQICVAQTTIPYSTFINPLGNFTANYTNFTLKEGTIIGSDS